MSEPLIDLLLRLAPRERLLLALLFLLVLPLAAWLIWLAPLADRRTDAALALKDARALNLWVRQRAADQALLTQTGGLGPQSPIGTSGIEQSLIAARLRDRISELTNQSGGVVELRFETVPFEDLINWLAESDPGWGYDIDNFRIERSDEPGIVFATLTLSPQE